MLLRHRCCLYDFTRALLCNSGPICGRFPSLFLFACSFQRWPFACFCHKLTFNQLGGFGHSVFDTSVQLTEGRSARDQPKQPPAKKDDVLKRWIQGEEGGPTTFVADQSRVHAIYSELAQLIKQKGRELHKNTDIPVVEELPRYPSVESASGQIPLPSIAQPVLPVKLNIELSKNDQRIEFGIDATVAHVNEDACWTLERASLALYFDAFRAPVTFGFDADTLLRLLWSESQLQKTQSVLHLTRLGRLRWKGRESPPKVPEAFRFWNLVIFPEIQFAELAPKR